MRLVLPPSVLTIEVSAPHALPPVITRGGLERRCRAGAPRDLVVDQVLMTTTALGWPCLAMWCRCGDTYLVRAYYRFHDHGALAEARTTDRNALARAWEILRSVRPDFAGEATQPVRRFA